MECPKCKDRLEEHDKYGLKVDICIGCNAIWFDRGELDMYRDRNTAIFAEYPKEQTFIYAINMPKRTCPRCETQTLSNGMAGDHEAWRCTKCNGYFIERLTTTEKVLLLGWLPWDWLWIFFT